MAIVDKITELIYKNGYNSVAAFEKQLGMGNGIIGKWKKQSPSCDKIALVADDLNCSVDYLLDREQQNGNMILSPSENALIDGYRELSEQGVDIYTIQKVMGHSDISVTLTTTEPPHFVRTAQKATYGKMN